MGIYKWADGSWREGEYVDGNLNGKVLFCDENGRAEEIIYENGE